MKHRTGIWPWVRTVIAGLSIILCIIAGIIGIPSLSSAAIDARTDAGSVMPESITIHLYQDGIWYDSKTVGKEEAWQYQWTELPKRNPDTGRPYEYTVREEPVPGWDAVLSDYDIANYPAATVTVEGKKTWDEAQIKDPVYPDSIQVHLLRNGERYKTMEVTAADSWAYRFEGLPENDQNGDPYVYTIEEEPVDGWRTSVNGYDLLNTAVRIKYHDIAVEKEWNTNGVAITYPSSVTVTLYRNNQVYETIMLSAANGWSYRWERMPETDDNMNPYEYRIEEETPDGWISEVTITDTGEEYRYHIRNSLEHLIDIRGKKSHYILGNNAPANYSGDIILCRMYKDVYETNDWDFKTNAAQIRALEGNPVARRELRLENYDQDDVQAFEFTDLPLYDGSTGRKYIYFVYEEDPGAWMVDYDYEPEEYDSYDIDNLFINQSGGGNSSSQDYIFEKVWDDDDDAGGYRPDSIRFILYRATTGVNVRPTDMGEYIAYRTITLSAENNWIHSEQLPQHYISDIGPSGDTYYFYEVREIELPISYRLQDIVYESDNYSFKIINTLSGVNEIGSLTGEKIWEDDNDRYQQRPDSIVVDLYCQTAAGDLLVDSRKVTAADNWKYEFITYNMYDGKEALGFYIREQEVEGYISSSTDQQEDGNGNIIINLKNKIDYTRYTTTFTVKKIWIDGNNAENTRPDSLTFRLYADGILYDTQTVSVADNLEYVWKDLPFYSSDGQRIIYTATEEEPGGYENESEHSEDGFGAVIINRLQYEETAIKGVKVWMYVKTGFTVVKKGGSDAAYPLEGAVFELYDAEKNTLVAEGTTDENGTLVFEDLEPGKYCLKEITAPPGYQLPDDPWTEVILAAGDTPLITIIEVENEALTGFTLFKTDDSGIQAPLAEAEFELYAEDKETLLDGGITDERGILSFYDLEPGIYYLKETAAPPGYQIPEDPWIELTLEAGTTHEVNIIQVENKPLAGFSLIKTDASEETLLLAGAEFELYTEDKTTLLAGGVTGADGRLSFEELRPGTYYLKEILPPPGYQLVNADDPWTEVILHQGDDPEHHVEMIGNEAIPFCSFSIQKVAQDDLEIPLEKAGFRIFRCTHEHTEACGGLTDEEQCSHTHEALITDYEEGNDCWLPFTDERISGDDGVIRFEGLTPGEYRLVETISPRGYQLPKGQWHLRIEYQDRSYRITGITAVGNQAEVPAIQQAEEGNLYQVDYLIPNQKSVLLPLTGGKGRALLAVTGIMMIAAGIGSHFWRKQKNRRKQL